MASNVRLDTVRTKVRQRTSYENSQFLTDPELTGWINDSGAELYDLLVASFEGYNVSNQDFAISTGNTFSVPATFYKLQGVDLIVSLPDQFQTLRRVSFAERNTARRGYDLRGPTVFILPYTWAAGNTYRLLYTPTYVQLVADSDTFDSIDGWEEYVIADVCIKVCAKSGEDASVFMAQKAGMTQRIELMSKNRDEGEPAHTTDINATDINGALLGGRYIYGDF